MWKTIHKLLTGKFNLWIIETNLSQEIFLKILLTKDPITRYTIKVCLYIDG